MGGGGGREWEDGMDRCIGGERESIGRLTGCEEGMVAGVDRM